MNTVLDRHHSQCGVEIQTRIGDHLMRLMPRNPRGSSFMWKTRRG